MQVVAHGIDLVEVARIEAMLRAHGGRFIQRCFTEAEREYSDAAANRRGERYAVRFTCKEAVFKALGTGWGHGVSWCEAAVVREISGQPRLLVTGRCAELAAQLHISHWQISLSHTAGLALASVLACR